MRSDFASQYPPEKGQIYILTFQITDLVEYVALQVDSFGPRDIEETFEAFNTTPSSSVETYATADIGRYPICPD